MARKKKRKPKWERVGETWVATLGNAVADSLKANRSGRRQEMIDQGMVGRGGKCGPHEGDKRMKRRRARRQANLDLNQSRGD